MAFTEDVTSLLGAQRAIQLAIEEWASFDGAVCCAGVLRHGPFGELSEEDFDAVIDTHLKGHFAMFQSAFRVLRERGRPGSLIGISSGYVSGDPLRSSYRAAKAAVIALTKSVAMAGATHGVRVNAIAPIANTRMTEASNLHFDSEPEDVAPLAVYLLSDVSEGVNGQVLGVSGRTINTWIDPQPSRCALNPTRWHWEDVASVMPWLLQREASGPPPLALDADTR